MKRLIKTGLLIAIFFTGFLREALAYPIDGYLLTGIRRLAYLQAIMADEIKGRKPMAGAQKSIEDIHLHLTGERGDSLQTLPPSDPFLQENLKALFPNLDESYSVALMDITPGRPLRYAEHRATRGFQPGSVGKLAVVTGFFCELENIYPDSFEQRRELLKNKQIRAGRWALPNQHTVPFYDPETKKFFKRILQANDVFSLYEWLDHMLSVSSNGAASVVWRETMLMRAFGPDYPALTEVEADSFFRETPRTQIRDIAMSVVNDPLREIGITEDEWRLGSLFTYEAKRLAPGMGGSIGTPRGLMKFMIAMERGALFDTASSLEVKRLLYLTDRRIRYAASPALKEAAVYFKSGSFYKCKPEEGYQCGKYRGNVYNYMNSVALVEHPNGTTYVVALMSNVLRRNSNYDHNSLASRIDRIMQLELE